MKKIVALMLSVVMMSSLCACGADKNEPSLENDDVTIDAIAVDDSYVDIENDNLALVYLFFTVHPEDKNIQHLSSMGLSMTINGENEYDSEVFSGRYYVDPYMLGSYYYDSEIEDIYMGDNKKMMSTFKVPKSDLEEGREISLFFGTGEIDADGLSLTTDLIKHYDTKDALAQAVDPEGYKAEQEKSQPADVETEAVVKAQMNNSYVKFTQNNLNYILIFGSENDFTIESGTGGNSISNSGTYEVLKGYIGLYYSGETEPTVKIPYFFDESGALHIDAYAGFNVM